MFRTDSLHRLLEDLLASGPVRIGQVEISPGPAGYRLCHVDDVGRADLAGSDPARVARYDSAGKFRPLKTAPSLSRGWVVEAATIPALHLALDAIYPAALGNWRAHLEGRLVPVALRTTVNRQTGMYRIAGKISDEQAEELVGRVCAAGCLRSRLWTVPEGGSRPLPACAGQEVPILCVEACNLLVAAARKVVKGIPLDQVE